MTDKQFLEELQALIDRVEEDRDYLLCLVDDVGRLIEAYDDEAEI